MHCFVINFRREKKTIPALRNVRCLSLIIHLAGKDPRTFPTILSPNLFPFRNTLENDSFFRACTRCLSLIATPIKTYEIFWKYLFFFWTQGSNLAFHCLFLPLPLANLETMRRKNCSTRRLFDVLLHATSKTRDFHRCVHE